MESWPRAFRELMEWCWQLDPELRPSFSAAIEELKGMDIEDGFS
jgi:hypothetical protein